jgi:hypothetical protein
LNSIEVLEKLEPICHTTARQIEHNPRTRVLVEPGQVTIRPGNGGRLIPVGENGVKALADFVDLPHNVCQRLSPDLFGRVTTELLARKERYNVLLENGEVRTFSDFRGIANLPIGRVLSTIEQGMPQCDFHRVDVFDNCSTALEIVGITQEAVRRGDLVRAGALVKFSPINTIRPSVQSFVLRLACTNGATSRTVLAEFTGGGGEGDNVWQWFRQSVRAASQSLGNIVERYRQMLEERIPPEQRAGVLEELLRQAGIIGKDAEAVRALAIQQAPRNSYEMMNLITYASSHIIEHPERRQRALNAAASFVDDSEHSTTCPLCHARHAARHEASHSARRN